MYNLLHSILCKCTISRIELKICFNSLDNRLIITYNIDKIKGENPRRKTEMKLTNEMIERIKDAAEDLYMDWEVVGVRVQEEEFSLGSMDHESSIWVDGEETNESAGGLCVVSADEISTAHQYFGGHIAIVCGNDYMYGEDPGEIILRDPVCVEVLV